MLYMTSDDGKLRVVILETANLEMIRSGKPVETPDGSVLIAWTPDPEWLAERILASNGNAQKIAEAIDEASKRPQKEVRPHHDTLFHKFTLDR